jgi:plasmid stabilization system protein ParE
MKYQVEVTEQASEEAEKAYLWIADNAPDTAARWFEGLVSKVNSLSTMPERCAFAPESAAFHQEIRQLLYGRYRILFTIEKDTVYVIHIRHSAQKPLKPDEE